MLQSRFGIYIGNVDKSVTLDQLKILFSQCGNIVDSSMNGSAENAYRFAFMDYATDAERQQALRLDGVTLANRNLKVAVSKGHVNHSGGGVSSGVRNNNNGGFQQQPGQYMQQQMGGGGGGFLPSQQYPPMGYMQPQQPSPQVIQQIIASMQAAGQLRPGQEPTPQQLQAIAAAAIAVQPQQQQQPMMMGGYGQQQQQHGGYHPQQQQPMMMQQMRPPHHAPANPTPSLEALALRAKQREQYLAKLRSEGERYESKIKKLLARGRGEAGGGSGGGSDSDSSNGSDSESEDDNKKEAANRNNNNNGGGSGEPAAGFPPEVHQHQDQQQQQSTFVAAVADVEAAEIPSLGEKRGREEDEDSIEG